MTETCKLCECESCDCECHDYDFNPSKVPLDKKIERIQHLSNAIVDATEDIGLTGMDRIKSLSEITMYLVGYEIEQHLKDKKKILDEYEHILKRRLEEIIISNLALDMSKFKKLRYDSKFSYYSDETREDNK
jgi:hypothetical protein